jgi:hypothetical protein
MLPRFYLHNVYKEERAAADGHSLSVLITGGGSQILSHGHDRLA